MAEKNSRL